MIQKPAHQELLEFLRDDALRMVVHGQVGIFPLACHAKTLELLALHVNPAIGEVPALTAEFHNWDGVLVVPLLAVLFLDFPFDWQPVAIPTRDIACIFAHHLLGAHDHIFQDFVQRMTNMQIAVCIWRTVMKRERGAALFLSQTVINSDLLPSGEPVGLAFG